ncbi:hypothetical protein CANARDRAFT_29198 [[Candida] arabinofermentans NRRL YB-2248]|uniref:Endoplasmic reticulum transmembrane protein n=1 Tax=[Candida] arabinofermentans NRRL YB-2248 TaxID=983967 RepID=A0A1E4SXV3_9ASCO|nr:hypothetical protein CANARDRAFT_29198 [[Candida] arabinofermentans NRRL YB-2248]
MALYYGLVFTLLMLEMLAFAVISLPIPTKFRKPLLKTLSIPFHSHQFKIVLKCIFGFILVLFIDSLNRMNKVNSELVEYTEGKIPGLSSGESRSEIQSRRFYAQRNTYLCGFTLFLTAVLNRTYSLVFELLAVKEQIKASVNDGKLNDLDTVDEKDVIALKNKIEEQDELIATLKGQAEGLSTDYEKI